MLGNKTDDIVSVESIQKRLKRIEGQLKGIQRMIGEDSCCMDILIQIAAVRAATNKVGSLILEKHMKECLRAALQQEQNEDKMEELFKVISSFVK